MAIEQILVLAAFAFVLGILARGRGRVYWLLAASILLVFWMQSPLPLRGLDFFLPLFSIGLVVLSWALTATPETRRAPETRVSAALILLLILGIAATRYLPFDILPSRPPSIEQSLLPLAGFSLAAWILVRRKTAASPILLWTGFGVLIAVFLVLKTPALSLAASRLWRLWRGQNPALAAATDIRWLGYSYLAFRLLHTIRDRQTRRLPDVTLGEYAVYALFFPAFTAGPIERIERFLRGLREPARTLEEGFLEGGERVAVGLFKKFVVADTLAMIALNPLSAGQVRAAGGAWILLYAYAFQIYFDFSGYTDIAIGLGEWMGIVLPENFKQPYRQPNLTLFWNNWHMTLTQWFRAYFFNPFARALRSHRKLPTWTMILLSQMATMLLIGAWHGMTGHFLLWGAWHGLGLFVQNRWSAWVKPRVANTSPRTARLLSLGGILLTFHFVALGWVWFALPAPEAWQFFLKLGGIRG